MPDPLGVDHDMFKVCDLWVHVGRVELGLSVVHFLSQSKTHICSFRTASVDDHRLTADVVVKIVHSSVESAKYSWLNCC